MHPMEVETLKRIEDMGIHIGVFDEPYPVDNGNEGDSKDNGNEE
jgi:hypothetical protein